MKARGIVKKPKPKKNFFKSFLIFFIFELLFTLVTMPILVFYGPFDNVKKTIVGASWFTLKHQYIAKAFLADDAIIRILGQTEYDQEQFDSDDAINKIDFVNNHIDKIDVYNIDGGDLKGKLMIIYDPTRIEVGYSSQIPKAGETTSTIAKKNLANAAINAGGFMDVQWAGTGGAPMGFIIHEGKMVYDQLKNNNVKQDTVALTKRGMLIVGKHSVSQLEKYGVQEGVSFGPALIVNGKPTITRGDGGWGIAPRTAIGQRKDGAILFLVIDGRSLKSFGASLRDVQDILLQYEAVNAANLDGGSSTTMYFNQKVINNPSDALGERAVPSAFLVLPMKEGDSE